MKIPHGHRVSRDGQGMPLDVMAAALRAVGREMCLAAVAAPPGSMVSCCRAPASP